MLFVRALFAFLACPGMMAIVVPIAWLFARDHTRLVHPLGLAPLVLGLVGLLACVRDFYVAGKGTLAPWSPPKELVIVGLYRFSRNPMYLAVTLVLLGWAASFGSTSLLLYAAGFFIVVHLRVVFGEEPWLARTHGDAWKEYASRVPRWLGRVRERDGTTATPGDP